MADTFPLNLPWVDRNSSPVVSGDSHLLETKVLCERTTTDADQKNIGFHLNKKNKLFTLVEKRYSSLFLNHKTLDIRSDTTEKHFKLLLSKRYSISLSASNSNSESLIGIPIISNLIDIDKGRLCQLANDDSVCFDQFSLLNIVDIQTSNAYKLYNWLLNVFILVF